MMSNKFRTKFLQIFLFLTVSLGFAAKASEDAEHTENKFDISTMIFHHIGDAHEWHFATIGHTDLSINLPVILYSADRGLEIFSFSNLKTPHGSHEMVQYAGYTTDHHGKIVSTDPNREMFGFMPPAHGHANPGATKVYNVSITKNIASLFLSVAILFLVFFSVASGYKKRKGAAPSGIQSFFEPIIVFIRDEIAVPNIGKKSEKFLPYLLTVFFFIWFNNLLGLVPGGANLTGNIAVTFSLAVFTLIITNFSANKDYWMHILWTPGIPMWLRPIMLPVELVGILSKPFSLMVRLFANITAGHVIILSLLGLTFIFESVVVGFASTLFSTVMSLLELFVAILQAYVFTLLSAMYFGQAVAEHEHHDDHH
jgi:F-type H+-transporting ATPase subunit a